MADAVMDSMVIMPKSALEATILAAYIGTNPNRQAHTKSHNLQGIFNQSQRKRMSKYIAVNATYYAKLGMANHFNSPKTTINIYSYKYILPSAVLTYHPCFVMLTLRLQSIGL